MANPIKYSTGSESDALNKGNFHIGTGAVGKGPSDVTGYYQAYSPLENGYVIYLKNTNQSSGISYHLAPNDEDLISFTNQIANQSYTGVQQCFDYYSDDDDKLCVNQDYPTDYPYIVMDKLAMYLDASINISYSGSGNEWYDINGLGPKNISQLTNGPTFSSNNGGVITFDSTDDYSLISYPNVKGGNSSRTMIVFFKATSSKYGVVVGLGAAPLGGRGVGKSWELYNYTSGSLAIHFHGGAIGPSTTYRLSENLNKWIMVACIYDQNINEATIKIYDDGTIYSGSGTPNQTINTSNNAFTINNSVWSYNYNPAMDGSVGCVLYYEKVLTDSELDKNYNSLKGRFTLEVEVLVVAGGGGGGGDNGGGGGAGGYRTTSLNTNKFNTNYTIIVGAGGTTRSTGNDSTFNTTISSGGGFGGEWQKNPGDGGSGGGGRGQNGLHSGSTLNFGGSGNTPLVSPTQGYDGGIGWQPHGGGGGGASEKGKNAIGGFGGTAGNGGDGLSYNFAGTTEYYAGGGGGGGNTGYGFGGLGGGGNGGTEEGLNSENGSTNTGGGGGGSALQGNSGYGYGGSGVVILKISDSYSANFSAGVTYSLTSHNGYKYYKVTATSTTSETVSFS